LLYQVNYVVKGANLYEDAGYQFSGSVYVIEKYLDTSWLWDKVREGCGCAGRVHASLRDSAGT
jgi:presequence protease